MIITFEPILNPKQSTYSTLLTSIDSIESLVSFCRVNKIDSSRIVEPVPGHPHIVLSESEYEDLTERTSVIVYKFRIYSRLVSDAWGEHNTTDLITSFLNTDKLAEAN